jgi:basic membrane lipoprotein Med (substrate-binding protein (PBP1-ABC) superfamily)
MKQRKFFVFSALILIGSMILASCAPASAPATQVPAATQAAAKSVVFAIEHFGVIAGSTWGGAQDRAMKRIEAKYSNVKYIYRENVAPDQSNPFAEDMIAKENANIVIGSAEFMGLPLKDIAAKYPDVYFGTVVASDLSTMPNFIRFFPRQDQALYLEGLIAGALTKTNVIGIVSAYPNIQVFHRQAGFVLGVQEAGKLLNKDIKVYTKYVGNWYSPPDEKSIAETLVDTYKADVLTVQTDSSAAVDVAKAKGVWFIGKDMDIVGELKWGDTNTVAVSFDTRWEVIFDKIIQEYEAGNKTPTLVYYPGMETTMTLADGTVEPTVDLMNDGKVGLDAISPKALPSIPQSILDLIKTRRDAMMAGTWDPFTANAFVSAGTGLELTTPTNIPVPSAGTVVKAAGVVPTTEFLLTQFNFDLQGTTNLK